MLQSTEYNVGQYLSWLWRTRNFKRVMLRKTLNNTSVTKSLRGIFIIFLTISYVTGGYLIVYGTIQSNFSILILGGITLMITPLLCAHLICLPILIYRLTILNTKNKKLTQLSFEIFSSFRGPKIAIVGSYGKTTAKELLLTVLSEGLNVKATPDNKNVLISHARFVQELGGEEDILIIEYGEGKPGDIKRFTQYTQPTHVVITGIAPAHLDAYKTIDAVIKDVFSSTEGLPTSHVLVNNESREVAKKARNYTLYDRNGGVGWKVSKLKMTITGMTFTLTKPGEKPLHLSTRLIGAHLVGILVAVVGLAYKFGLTREQIIEGVAKTTPYQHRMQPYPLHGGWVIDDSYNGNIDGVRAGLELLRSLEAKRKIYVSPGLVEQGAEKEKVHETMGLYIAATSPDIVVLMKNSTTKYIQKGLNQGKYQGEVRIEENPLNFYQNIDNFIAAGDIVLLQNDWTDNYV